MPILRSILLGPEALWLAIYLAVSWFAARNDPPTEAGNRALESVWWLIPLAGIPPTFALYLLHPEARWGFLIRVNLAVFVGLNAAVLHAVGAIDYGDSRNSGLLAVWIMPLSFMIVMLPIGDVLTALFLWRVRKGE